MSGFAISKLAIMDFHRLLECESIHKSLIVSDPETNLQNNSSKSKNEELTKDKQKLRN